MSQDVPSLRRDAIQARLAAGQPVASGALAEEFGVSEDAVRRDLRALAAEGRCRRVYGGALPLDAGLPMDVRDTRGVPAKRALARAAVPLIEPGRFLFLDSGSTNLRLAEALPYGLDLTVATNSISIAAAIATRADLELLIVGGAVDTAVGGCIDSEAVAALSRLNIDLCFLGACALSADGGVSAFGIADAAFKRALTLRSARTMVLATNDKLNARAPHRIVPIDQIERIVLEHDAPHSAAQALAAAGTLVSRAAPPKR